MSDWPHVTAILKSAGLVDDRWFSEDAAQKGTAVHLACQYLDEGDLDEDSLADDVRGRVAAYRKFHADVQPKVHAIEQGVTHQAMRYCGTLDRIMEIGGTGWVVDLKGPYQAPWQALQVEAYRRCVDWTPKRATLHLHDDGTYKFIEHRGRDDWGAFLAALTIHNWKERTGCLTSP